jgi:hypothetical protein
MLFAKHEGCAVYLVTAWNDASEQTVRSISPKVILEKARELVGQGMRITIVRTATGEAVAISDLEAEIAHAQGT